MRSSDRCSVFSVILMSLLKFLGPGVIVPPLLQALMSEVESRTQGSRPRPRTQKKSEAKDTFSEDRHSRGQGPRTQAQVLSKKKRSSQKFFRRSPQKNVFQKIFQVLLKILTIQKIVLSSSRGHANFRGLEAKDLTFDAKAKDFKMCLEAKDVLEDSTFA